MLPAIPARRPGGVVDLRLRLDQTLRFRPGHEDITGHNICVAGSTGLAPVICLIEAALAASPAPSFTLVFDVRRAEDLFAVDRLDELSRRHPGRLRIVPMLSDEPEGSRWRGGRGLVTAALTGALAVDPATTRAFLCGNAAMVDTCERRLVVLGVATSHIHADRFAPTGATVAAIMAP
jgi:ferredoxin-NADP reductase